MAVVPHFGRPTGTERERAVTVIGSGARLSLCEGRTCYDNGWIAKANHVVLESAATSLADGLITCMPAVPRVMVLGDLQILSLHHSLDMVNIPGLVDIGIIQ
jgi:hypothetical protein